MVYKYIRISKLHDIKLKSMMGRPDIDFEKLKEFEPEGIMVESKKENKVYNIKELRGIPGVGISKMRKK